MATKLIVILGFVVAFSSGLVVGLNQHGSRAGDDGPSTQPAGPRGPRGPRGGWLPRELNLTSEQQEQMKQIWSQVAFRSPREQDDLRRQYRKERDDAVLAMLTAEQRAEYDRIVKTYQDQLAAMDQEFRKAFDEAVKRTNDILTDEQKVKYEEIRRRNQPWDRGPRGDRGREQGRDEDNRRGAETATSHPSEK